MNIIKTNLVFGALTKRTKTTKAVWHNSGVTVLQSVETIHNYHKNTNGWAGIGYHLYVRKDGLIYEGRPLDTVGAHAYGSNSDSIGICFEGNFDKEQMTDKQIEAGKWIASYLRSIYPDIKFCGHRDLCKTSCPGANFKFDEIVNGQAVPEENNNKEEFEMAKTYKNGSTIENVYADTNLKKKIGSLNKWEQCECLGIVNGRYIVKYKIDGTNNYKIGFVAYHGGVA